jgi:hypothetical protein
VPFDLHEAAARGNYRAALRKFDQAICHARLNDDVDGAEALGREADRIAEESSGRTRKRALELAEESRRAAVQMRASLDAQTAHGKTGSAGADTEAVVEKEVSPVSLGLTLLGAAVMLVAVFLPRVDSNTFARVAQNTLIQSGGGWWFIGIAVILAGSAWFSYQHHAAGAGPMVLGLIAIGIAVYYGTSKSSLTLCPVNQSAANALGIGCTKASPGVGIYAAGVGGLLAAIGGWQMWRAPHVVTGPDETHDKPEFEPADELETRLRRLETLRERGLLSDEEYAQRRQVLLDQL